MPRQRKNIVRVFLGIALVSFALAAHGQTVPDSLIDTIVEATQVTPGQPTSIDASVIRRMIEQRDEMVRRGTEAAINVQPVFDGRNLTFVLNGVTYVFDVTSEARKVTAALTKLTVTPKAPRAHEEITVQVQNYSTNILEDRITWTVNDVVVQDEIGGTSIRVRMGAIGEETRIMATIFSRKLGELFSKEIVLVPGDVAILWEADTHIPPFYKGKPLPSYKSTIKLIPFPTVLIDGKLIPPQQIFYEWNRNSKDLDSISGYGKRFAFFEAASGVRQERLKLTVKHLDSGAGTEREVLVNIVSPKLLLYAGSPLQGVRYEEALGKAVSLDEQETTLRAEPFFVSNEDLSNGSASLTWKQNGKTIPSLFRSVTLQRSEGGGASRIDATFENPARILQSVRNSLTINY
jgi:hypothetical protein